MGSRASEGFKGGRVLHGLCGVLSGSKDKRGLCWGWAGTRRGDKRVSPGEGGRAFEAEAAGWGWGGAAGKGCGVCVPPHSPAGALWPPCGQDGPEVPDAAESCFCAAAWAPVPLTLEPAAYLSNSKGNSAANEGKKITSAAKLGGKRP